MATDIRNHEAPASGETPRRQTLNDLSLSINDVVFVANATARAQKLTEIGATAARPLLVRQQDTGDYWEHNGSSWARIGGRPATSAMTFTAEYTGGVSLTRIGSVVTAEGVMMNSIAFTGGLTAGVVYQAGAIPSGYRPQSIQRLPSVGVIGGTSGVVAGRVEILTDGTVQYVLAMGAASIPVNQLNVPVHGAWTIA